MDGNSIASDSDAVGLGVLASALAGQPRATFCMLSRQSGYSRCYRDLQGKSATEFDPAKYPVIFGALGMLEVRPRVRGFKSPSEWPRPRYDTEYASNAHLPPIRARNGRPKIVRSGTQFFSVTGPSCGIQIRVLQLVPWVFPVGAVPSAARDR